MNCQSCADHEHSDFDIAAAIRAAIRNSFALSGTTLGLSLVAAVVTGLAGGTPASMVLVVSAAVWVLATYIGAFTTAVRAQQGKRDFAVSGAVATGALAGVSAVLVAGTFDDAAWTAAAAGAGLAAAAMQVLQSRAFHRSLRQPGELGEMARDQAVHRSPATARTWVAHLTRWAATALVFGLWVWLLGVSWWTVLVVVPGAVALQLFLARRALQGRTAEPLAAASSPG